MPETLVIVGEKSTSAATENQLASHDAPGENVGGGGGVFVPKQPLEPGAYAHETADA